jgi:hypothetical protein
MATMSKKPTYSQGSHEEVNEQHQEDMYTPVMRAASSWLICQSFIKEALSMGRADTAGGTGANKLRGKPGNTLVRKAACHAAAQECKLCHVPRPRPCKHHASRITHGQISMQHRLATTPVAGHVSI